MKVTVAKTVKDLMEVLSLIDPASTWVVAADDDCIYIDVPGTDEYEAISPEEQ
jgi:hypothetical protein